MHTTSRFLARLSTVALLTLFPPPCLANRDVDVREDDPRDAMHIDLDRLRSGGAEERRRIVEDELDWILDLDFDDPRDEEAVFAAAALTVLLQAEPDEWIANELLRSLLVAEGVLLDPLFRDELRGPSPNRRWIAIRYFHSREDPKALPLLEDSWRSEKRPWVAADLIGALVANGSSRYLDDFRRLAWSGDEALSEAALQAILVIHDDDCLGELIDLAREGRAPIRRKALEGLASWPDSSRALDALIDASRSDQADLARAAVTALGKFHDEVAARRLMEMAREHDDDAVRRETLDSLERLRPQGFVELLLELIEEAPTVPEWNVQRKALGQVRALDDVSLLPRLERLLASGKEAPEGLAELVRDLSGKAEEAPGEVELVTITCGGALVTLVAPRFRIDPGGRHRTVRCWERPGSAGDPEEFPRIPAGSGVWVLDHFEHHGVSWAEIGGPKVADCWVPLDVLLPAAAEDEAATPAAVSDPFRREADVPAGELRSPRVARLREAGLLEIFDPSDTVAAVALAADPARPESIPLLLEAYRNDGSVLSVEIGRLLRALQAPGLRRTESESSVEGTQAGAAPEEAEPIERRAIPPQERAALQTPGMARRQAGQAPACRRFCRMR